MSSPSTERRNQVIAARPISRRQVVVGSSALAALTLTACGRRAGGAGDILRAATYGKGESDTRLLFRLAGLKPENFDIAYAEFQSGQLVIEALNGGSLDVGGMSEIPPVFALAAAVQSFRQVAVLRGDVNNQVVLVPRGSRIAGLADLKGKRIGYVRATTSQYFLIRMLQSVGLGWGDITPVALGVSDGASAFSAGALDAWAIYGYPIQRAVATEGARVLATAKGFLSGNYIVAAHVDALADPAEARRVGDYLRLLRRGYAWAAGHEAQWASAVAASVGVPAAYIRDQFARKSAGYALLPVTPAAIASQQGVADLFAEQKLIPRRVDVRPLWDDRYTALLTEKG